MEWLLGGSLVADWQHGKFAGQGMRPRGENHKGSSLVHRSTAKARVDRAIHRNGTLMLPLESCAAAKKRRSPGRQPWPQKREQPECRASETPSGKALVSGPGSR
jgi:hypothetical protein